MWHGYWIIVSCFTLKVWAQCRQDQSGSNLTASSKFNVGLSVSSSRSTLIHTNNVQFTQSLPIQANRPSVCLALGSTAPCISSVSSSVYSMCPTPQTFSTWPFLIPLPSPSRCQLRDEEGCQWWADKKWNAWWARLLGTSFTNLPWGRMVRPMRGGSCVLKNPVQWEAAVFPMCGWWGIKACPTRC